MLDNSKQDMNISRLLAESQTNDLSLTIYNIIKREWLEKDYEFANIMDVCVIPPRINLEIIEIIIEALGYKKIEGRGQSILSELAKLSFIQKIANTEDFAYHDSLRNPLLDEWQSRENFDYILKSLEQFYIEKFIELKKVRDPNAISYIDQLVDISHKPEDLISVLPFYIIDDNPSRVLDIIDTKVPEESRDAKLLNLRGIAYAKLKDYEKAFNDFNHAISLNPEDASFWINIGNVYEELRNYEKAIECFTHAIDLEPDNANFYNRRGIVNGDLKHYSESLKDFNHAIKLKPDVSIFYLFKAITHGNLSQYDDAINALTQAINLDPDNANLYKHRGIFFDELGKHELAIRDLNQAVKLEPKNAGTWNTLGLLYSHKRDYEEADNCYIEALKLYNRDVTILYNHVIVLVKLYGVKKVQPDIAKVKQKLLDKSISPYVRAYGLAGLEAIQKNTDALEMLQKALELDIFVRRWARTDIAWDDFRDNPEFKALLEDN